MSSFLWSIYQHNVHVCMVYVWEYVYIYTVYQAPSQYSPTTKATLGREWACPVTLSQPGRPYSYTLLGSPTTMMISIYLYNAHIIYVAAINYPLAFICYIRHSCNVISSHVCYAFTEIKSCLYILKGI